ncbi:hypothetical protein QQF64_024071 [Cirrhinus molitorella]|uniref:Uncharacterized protein n=1 Tax=Cirrhinus molitorella TaxID=172907 RepID=A0ABR3NK90_9TELE
MSHLSPYGVDTDTPSKQHTDDRANHPSSMFNVSQNQVIQHRKVKEPPSFKGDSSDTIEIEEWEDLMKTFVKKSNMSADEHVEEILVHLRGKAKDVVKFWIRNCDSAIAVCPNSVYSLLRKHFSSNHYSPVPLADFYTTLPEEDENPYDYWLRLNKAADVASECPREQGKTLDKPQMENSSHVYQTLPNPQVIPDGSALGGDSRLNRKTDSDGEVITYLRELVLLNSSTVSHFSPKLNTLYGTSFPSTLRCLWVVQYWWSLPNPNVALSRSWWVESLHLYGVTARYL